MEKQCPQCGDYFWADEDWKHLCLDCWLQNKRDRRERGGSRHSATLLAENARLKRKIDELENENFRLSLMRTDTPTLDPAILKLLVQLTHPDKHNGSPAAIKATKYLLKMRKGG